jgi:hypothetical protein
MKRPAKADIEDTPSNADEWRRQMPGHFALYLGER